MASAETNQTDEEAARKREQKRVQNAKRREALATRRRDALELRKGGATYDAIATHLGISETQARKDVEYSLKNIYKEPAEHVLALETERLDRLFLEAYTIATSSKLLPDGTPRYSVEARLRAIDRCVKIMERRSRLLGLDTIKIQTDITPVTNALKSFATNLKRQEGINE